MAGYASADKLGNGDVRYSGNTWNGSTWVNGTPNPNYLAERFNQMLPRKPGGNFSLTPDTADDFVYADEFINWVKTNYGYGQTDPNKPIWFSLDNEPDLWNSTHAEVHPSAPTYAEMVQRTTDWSKAIKDVEPGALVFGPVNYGWQGYIRLQNAPDANGRDFQEFYLAQMNAASQAAGKRLLDVLDVHWYPEAHGTNNIRITEQDTSAATVAARLQAPRSLWDPTYTESSWITQFSTLGPIDLIPRLNTKINNNFAGTKLAITEYNYGAGNHISGAIAQADVLGIFGREGIFAANEWPLAGNEAFIGGAFKIFRNYDGANSTFGSVSLSATTDRVADSSVYASYDPANPNVMTVVAINKTAGSLIASLNLAHVLAGAQASAYQLTSASPTPVFAGNVAISNPDAFQYTMPAYSVTTLRIQLAAPIAKSWTGQGDGIHWTDSSNWAGNSLPTVNDDVNINVAASNPTIIVDGAQSVRTISANETLRIAGSLDITGTNQVARVTSLLFDTGGTLDLRDNDLIIDYTGSSALAATQSQINAHALWSSIAQDNPQHNTTLAAMEATDYRTIYGPTASFDGQSIDNTTVLVKYTYYGDTDFNGTVNFDDYSRTDAGFNQDKSGWLNGDFDGNGVVNFDDYSLIDLAFNTQNGALMRTGSPRDLPRRAATHR
jgi:hypothetical protein